ncbi:hypothetical protein [Cohnella sp. JJ-181]|uniref:hypothetical protein n=1 Tax=Cohnella rhizoplanae TaxID=2974897 RepID=UPI00233082D1|nr:hypothetical protein [Cohnella sp. JJ-181]
MKDIELVSNDPVEKPVGRLLLTHDYLLVEADSNFCRMFGFTPQPLQGISFESILTRASQILFHLHFVPSLRINGVIERLRLSLKSGNATEVLVIVSASVLNAADSPATFEVIVTNDP